MMLKKYVQPNADITSVTPDVKTTVSPCATVTSVPSTDERINQTAPAKLEGNPTVKNEMFVSVIDKHLATNSITVLEKHYPEIESELNEIGYLLNGIAEHIGEAEDLIRNRQPDQRAKKNESRSTSAQIPYSVHHNESQ